MRTRINLLNPRIPSNRTKIEPRGNDRRCIFVRPFQPISFWTVHKIFETIGSTLLQFCSIGAMKAEELLTNTETSARIGQFSRLIVEELQKNLKSYEQTSQVLKDRASEFLPVGNDCEVMLEGALNLQYFGVYLRQQVEKIIIDMPGMQTPENIVRLFKLVSSQLGIKHDL